MQTLGSQQLPSAKGNIAVVSFVVLIGLAACGGAGNASQSGSAGSNIIPNTASAAHADAVNTPSVVSATPQPVQVNLTYTLPTATTAVSPPGVSTQSVIHRHLQYISTSNTLMSVMVTPIGGTPTTYGPNACTSASCTASFTANSGPTTIAFTLTDGSSNILSQFATTTIIQPATINTLSFTANPVVHSATLQLANTSVNAGTPVNDLLTLQAKDADGNIIVGNNNYVDVNGNPVTFTLNVTNTQAGGKGTVIIQGPTYITGPTQAATYAHYDGNWLTSSVISITSSSSAVTSLTSATLSTTPTDYAYSNGVTAGQHLQGIATGPDGNLWVGEINPAGILRMTPSGVGHEFSSGITSGAYPQYPVIGPDGNLWFAEFAHNAIARITTSGTITEFTGMSGSEPVRIAVAPGGQMWFTQELGNYIGTITTQGTISNFSTSTNSPRGLGIGPDGNAWVASSGSKTLSRFTPNDVETDFSYTTSYACLTNSNDNVVTGPDGNLWFITCDQQGIGKSTPSGSITVYTANLSSSPYINDLTVGPDNNIWFTEGAPNRLGRITTSGTITEFSLASGGSGPFGVALGPDNNLWIAFYGSAFVSKFVY